MEKSAESNGGAESRRESIEGRAHFEGGEVVELGAEERELVAEARVLVPLRVRFELDAPQLSDLRLELDVLALEFAHLRRQRRLARLVLLELHARRPDAYKCAIESNRALNTSQMY